MPRPPTPKDVQEQILADWRTGEYSIRAIAYRHDVSSALVGKLVKGVPKDLVDVIDAGVKYRTTLLQENRHVEDAVSKIVDEKTRHIAFFANATIKNISLMMEKVRDHTSIDEHKTAQEAILKGRETVLGKSPETAVQVNMNVAGKKSADDYSEEELARIIEG